MHILLSPAMLPRLTTAAVLAVSPAMLQKLNTADCFWSAVHALASTNCARVVCVCLEGQQVLVL